MVTEPQNSQAQCTTTASAACASTHLDGDMLVHHDIQHTNTIETCIDTAPLPNAPRHDDILLHLYSVILHIDIYTVVAGVMPYSIRLHIDIHRVIVAVLPYNVILHIDIYTVDAAVVLCSYTVICAVM